jgi:hypothetical protein
VEAVDSSRELLLAGPVATLQLSPASRPSLARLETDTPVVARIEAGGKPARVEVFERGASLSLVLTEARTEVRLRGVAGRPLSGMARVVLEPLGRLGEGIGEELTIPPGTTRVLLVEVARPGRIGIGIRAVPGQVAAELRDSAGQRVSEGVQQMPQVSAGLYSLHLTAPAEGPPQRVRPAVVGVDPPGTGPPPEVIETYLKEHRAGTGGAQ